MENVQNEVVVRIVQDESGFFIGRAVGYPGVIAYARSEDQMMKEIEAVWHGMAAIDAVKKIGGIRKPKQKGAAREKTFSLQVA